MPVPYIRFALPETTRSGASTMARGHGVGRALFRAAVDEARRQGARRITLRVLGHNTPARKLYESEGFVVEGVQPGEFFLDGEYVDDVLMGRGLQVIGRPGAARRAAVPPA